MTTMGMRGLLASVLIGSFGLLGAQAAPVPGASDDGAQALGARLEEHAGPSPSLWAVARHSACVVSRAASDNENRGADRRRDCDRELLASH